MCQLLRSGTETLARPLRVRIQYGYIMTGPVAVGVELVLRVHACTNMVYGMADRVRVLGRVESLTLAFLAIQPL